MANRETELDLGPYAGSGNRYTLKVDGILEVLGDTVEGRQLRNALTALIPGTGNRRFVVSDRHIATVLAKAGHKVSDGAIANWRVRNVDTDG